MLLFAVSPNRLANYGTNPLNLSSTYYNAKGQ